MKLKKFWAGYQEMSFLSFNLPFPGVNDYQERIMGHATTNSLMAKNLLCCDPVISFSLLGGSAGTRIEIFPM